MNHPYYETFQLIERLHRYFLEMVKIQLDKNNILDLNNVQAMILYNMGDDVLTVGELTNRGYYQGSNVSYNVSKMAENGYLTQERSLHDKRSIRLKKTDKAVAVCQLLQSTFQKHTVNLEMASLAMADLVDVNDSLRKLERFWTVALAQGL